MRVLVACEYSGVVRDAFAARGHDAVSADFLGSEAPNGKHIRGDVLAILGDGWDLMVCHPPCTLLAVSGARWMKGRMAQLGFDWDHTVVEALAFVQALLDAPIAKIALENPVSIISTHIRKPDQIIHPWQHGHGERKTTCLWLKGLPKITPSNIVAGRKERSKNEPPGPDRWKNRSRTFTGIAKAMAAQWG